MSSDSPSSLTDEPIESPAPVLASHSPIRLKSEGEKLLLILPKADPQAPPQDWTLLLQKMKACLKRDDRAHKAGTPVYLMVQDRLLDGRQLQAIAEALQEMELQLKCVGTTRRQTAVAAATAGYSVEQTTLTRSLTAESQVAQPLLAEPLYLKATVRSGMDVRHPGTVILLGDVNPGGEIMADGDILIWGTLRGIAHAGARGNLDSRIMALRLEPTQLRIASVVARPPTVTPEEIEPEVAYLTAEGIRITKALNFTKTHAFDQNIGGWMEINAE
jgi:septum site-determining protein MinC